MKSIITRKSKKYSVFTSLKRISLVSPFICFYRFSMKDIVTQYKKHTFFQNSAIVLASLAIALGINMYVLDGQFGNYLKSSVLDINGVEQTADVYGRVSENRDTITLGTQRPMNNVVSISLSLVYDSENVSVNNIFGTIEPSSVSIISDEPWIKTLLITFGTPQTLKGEADFVTFDVSKENPATAYVNVINANFKDAEGKWYLLSTSGILF